MQIKGEWAMASQTETQEKCISSFEDPKKLGSFVEWIRAFLLVFILISTEVEHILMKRGPRGLLSLFRPSLQTIAKLPFFDLPRT